MKLYPCDHAFMRDEGPRYDPEATDRAFTDMIGLFRGVFA
jgi:carboxymethylenebutenolidase